MNLKVNAMIDGIKLIILVFICVYSSNLYPQDEAKNSKIFIPVLGRELNDSEIFHPGKISKRPGHYSREEWSALTSGIYFYQLRVNDLVKTKKMVLLR